VARPLLLTRVVSRRRRPPPPGAAGAVFRGAAPRRPAHSPRSPARRARCARRQHGLRFPAREPV